MFKFSKIIILSILFIVVCSCNSIKNKGFDNPQSTQLNTKPNQQYKESRKSFKGKLNKAEYSALILQLEEELGAKIPEGKSILINFNQRASNCVSAGFNSVNNLRMTNRVIEISSRMTSERNALDFFVYTNDSYFKEIFETKKEFILDSGFFYNEIFTKHENCGAFLILKPNGKFYKNYGEDYFSYVDRLL